MGLSIIKGSLGASGESPLAVLGMLDTTAETSTLEPQVPKVPCLL